jgi:hypothetical protein
LPGARRTGGRGLQRGAGRNVTIDERGVIQQALEKKVRERAAGTGAAKLTNPINIGVGTK